MAGKKRKFRMSHPKTERDLETVVEEVSEMHAEEHAHEHAHEHHHHHHGEVALDELLSAMATSLHILEHEIEDMKIRIRVIEAKVDQIYDMINTIAKKIK